MHFITNGNNRFSKTNSTDQRQGVPLSYSEAIHAVQLALTWDIVYTVGVHCLVWVYTDKFTQT